MVNKPGFEGLHLVPLSRITQLRPTFQHVDEATASATATTDEDTLKAEAELSSLGRKPLSFQKKESERAAMIRKSTYAYKRMSEESELWQNLNVHDRESMEAKSTMDKITEGTSQKNLMTLTNPNSAVGPLNDEYIRTLNYLPSRNNKRENGDEGDAAAVVTKLVDLMQEGWPIPYKVLKRQFSSAVSENMLIEALASCAFLVRGNFVLQSKLLSFNQSIAHARTFLLFLLQTIEVVHRLRLEQVYEDDDEVTTEIILMLLKQVGRSTPDGWKLRVEDDLSFGINHPNAVVVHLSFWTSQLRRFQPLLDLYRQDPT
jgi:DNA-directed RNA polymerase-3 subunit RPC5